MHRPSQFARRGSGRAFTLIELLAVMTIIGVLAYVAGPALASLQESTNIGLTGQSVSDEIAVAREIAATRNQVVELRFITPTSWAALGSPAYTGVHALQLWGPNATGTPGPIDKVVTLPAGIELSTNSTLSPLLSTLVGASTSMPAGPTTGKYVSFFVRPSGGLQVSNPPADAAGASEDNAGARAPQYFFTILSVRSDASASLPHDYLTIQLNPDTGRTGLYRP